jgi:hypothetical protein
MKHHQSTCAVSSSKDTVVFNFVSFLRMTKQDPSLCSIRPESSTIKTNQNAINCIQSLLVTSSCPLHCWLNLKYSTIQYSTIYCPEESHKERLRRKEVRYTVQHKKMRNRTKSNKNKKRAKLLNN